MKVLNQNVKINVRLQVSVRDIEIRLVLALILTVWSSSSSLFLSLTQFLVPQIKNDKAWVSDLRYENRIWRGKSVMEGRMCWLKGNVGWGTLNSGWSQIKSSCFILSTHESRRFFQQEFCVSFFMYHQKKILSADLHFKKDIKQPTDNMDDRLYKPNWYI